MNSIINRELESGLEPGALKQVFTAKKINLHL